MKQSSWAAQSAQERRRVPQSHDEMMREGDRRERASYYRSQKPRSAEIVEIDVDVETLVKSLNASGQCFQYSKDTSIPCSIISKEGEPLMRLERINGKEVWRCWTKDGLVVRESFRLRTDAERSPWRSLKDVQ